MPGLCNVGATSNYLSLHGSVSGALAGATSNSRQRDPTWGVRDRGARAGSLARVGGAVAGRDQKCERMYAGGAGNGMSPTVEVPHVVVVVLPLANRTFQIPGAGFQ